MAQIKRSMALRAAWLLLALAGLPRIALAADVKTEYQMEEMVVTATRSEAAAGNLAADVMVISSEEIAGMPAASVAEVLRHAPGVYVEFNGGPGSEATTIRIQGCETRHVAVYQDGVPLNMLADPKTDLAYLSLDAIDRIEVYKGTASSAWGSALGGVINIITKVPKRQQPVSAEIQTRYGEFGTWKNRAVISGIQNRLSWMVSGTHDKSDGFVPHTAFERDAVYAKAGYDWGTGSRLNFAYRFDTGQNGDPAIAFPAFWDDQERRRTYQHLRFETAPTDRTVLIVEGRHHRYQNRIEDVYTTFCSVWNDYTDETWGGGARLNWAPGNNNRFNAGIEGDWGRYDWVHYTEEYHTENRAAWVNDTAVFGRLTLTAGLRYDDNKDFGSEISPSAGLVYRFSPLETRLRLHIARGFSAPPAAWVHDPTFGNPALKPETAVNYQAGGEIRPLKWLTLSAGLFRSEVDHLIRFDTASTRYQNIDSVTRQGVESTAAAAFGFGLTLSASVSHADVRDDRTDAAIADIPSNLIRISAQYETSLTTQTVFASYTDHNSSYAETLDKRFVVDYTARLRLPLAPKTWKAPEIFAAVHNLFDSGYLYRRVWPQPGRWAEAGLRLTY